MEKLGDILLCGMLFWCMLYGSLYAKLPLDWYGTEVATTFGEKMGIVISMCVVVGGKLRSEEAFVADRWVL
jgi:hypothetical protein